MKRVILNNENIEQSARQALSVLIKGGSVVTPTDTVYGLAANACDQATVEQVFKIKKRDPEHALPVLVRDIYWAREVAFIPPKLEPYLSQLWPGPVTVVLPKKRVIPSIVSGGSDNIGVAVRIADNVFLDRLLNMFGYPLTGTSANLAGAEGSDDPDKIASMFKGEIWQPDLLIDAGPATNKTPSTIIDFTSIKPRIIRSGAVSRDKLESILSLSNL